MNATLASVWEEAHPLSIWRYDWPDRQMARWEMPAYRTLAVVRRLLMRPVLVWHLLVTGPNTATEAPWGAGGWRRVKMILALLLPVPIRWRYPGWGTCSADSVLCWWSSGPIMRNEYTGWEGYFVGVGYGRCWHVYVWQEGE